MPTIPSGVQHPPTLPVRLKTVFAARGAVLVRVRVVAIRPDLRR